MAGTSPLLVPYLSAATLTGVAGASKLRDSRLAAAAAIQLGLRVGAPAVVYATATAEILLAVAAWTASFAVSGAAILAALYLGFAITTTVLWRRAADVSCGCFGVRSVAVTGLHVCLNGLAAVTCAMAAFWPVRLGAISSASARFAAVFEVIVGTYLLIVVYTQVDLRVGSSGVPTSVSKEPA